jgi:hypothetical protein
VIKAIMMGNVFFICIVYGCAFGLFGRSAKIPVKVTGNCLFRITSFF